MESKNPLKDLKWFKRALWCPIALAGIIAIYIAVHSLYIDGFSACWSAACINQALRMMKLPISIAALAFPLVALVASHHRSVQTAAQIERTDKQIKAAEDKNAFENNIKHRELFNALLERKENKLGISLIHKEALYDSIFTENQYSSFSIYSDTMKSTNCYCSEVQNRGVVPNKENHIEVMLNELLGLLSYVDHSHLEPEEERRRTLEVTFDILEEFNLFFMKTPEEFNHIEIREYIKRQSIECIDLYLISVFDVLSDVIPSLVNFSISKNFIDEPAFEEKYIRFCISIGNTIKRLK